MSPDRSKYCYSSDVAYGIFMYQAVMLFACDIIIFLLPFPALIKLNMGSAKKTALLLVFGSGAVACIAPAVRFESIQFYKSGSSDTTCELGAVLLSLEYNQLLIECCSLDAGAESLYWMAIEYNLGLVAGSLTGLRPLLSRIGVLLSSKGDSNYKSAPFAPSYKLEDRSNKHWASSQRSGVKKDRHQGDSVLDQTVMGDRISDDSGRQHILKTQSISITEESRDDSSFANTAHQPWQDPHRNV